MRRNRSVFKTIIQGIPQSTLRQWRSTPTYIFLVWRWGTWMFAFIWYLALPREPAPNVRLTFQICLIVTLLHSLIVTLYAPVSRFFLTRLPRLRKRDAAHKEQNLTRSLSRARQQSQLLPSPGDETRIIAPLVNTRNKYLNVSIYILDVVICGCITYVSGVNSNPPFGIGSPFYRYGLSAVLVSGFTYSYGGATLATLGDSAFGMLGAFVHAPSQTQSYLELQNPLDIASARVDAPPVGLLAAYLENQLNKAILTKRQEQDRSRRERSLRGVSEMLVTEINDQVQFLQRSVQAIRQGGHFE